MAISKKKIGAIAGGILVLLVVVVAMAGGGGGSNSSASAAASKDAVGLGEYKLGMSIDEVRGISSLRTAVKPHDFHRGSSTNLFIFIADFDAIEVPTETYSDSSGLYLYFIDNVLVAIGKRLKDEEFSPTWATIKSKYSGKEMNNNTIIGKDGNKAFYMIHRRGEFGELTIYSPSIQAKAIEIDKSTKDAAKKKSVL